MDEDPFYNRCCLTGYTGTRIDWHHCFTYRSRQINEAWAIMPVWEQKHSPQGDKDSVHNCKETKDYVEYLSLKRATAEDFKKYPKADFAQKLKYLTKKYEKIGGAE